jgi:tripartite-type tricarboxylate transporter receptor subunit TctC
MGHLTAELFQRNLGIKMTHVPYNGAPQAMNDLIAGRVNLSFDLLPIYTGYIKSNKLKALAVTTLMRVPDLPEVATLTEQGVPRFEVVGWIALVGPTGLAPETIEKLNHVVNEFIGSAEGKSALAKFGMEPRGGSPRDLANLMASELTKWAPVAGTVTAE